MPLYDRVNYADSLRCPDCTRTTQTLTESMMWLGFYVGGIVFEAARRNWRNLAFIGAMGGGFAIAFTVFEWFHTLPNLATAKIGWWKYWETSVGTVGGITLGICFCLFNRPLSDATIASEGIPPGNRHPRAERLFGVWLPMLVSFYMVVRNEVPRFAAFLGNDSEWFDEFAPLAAVLILVAVGMYAAYRIGREPHPERAVAVSPALFAVPYVLLFLMSYVPQFGKAKVWENWPYIVQLFIYAALFLTGLACFLWINTYARRAPANDSPFRPDDNSPVATP